MMIPAGGIEVKNNGSDGWATATHVRVVVEEPNRVWLGLFTEDRGAPPVIVRGGPFAIVRLFAAIGAEILKQRGRYIDDAINALRNYASGRGGRAQRTCAGLDGDLASGEPRPGDRRPDGELSEQ